MEYSPEQVREAIRNSHEYERITRLYIRKVIPILKEFPDVFEYELAELKLLSSYLNNSLERKSRNPNTLEKELTGKDPVPEDDLPF